MNTLEKIESFERGYMQRLDEERADTLAGQVVGALKIIATQEFERGKGRLDSLTENHKPLVAEIVRRIDARNEQLRKVVFHS